MIIIKYKVVENEFIGYVKNDLGIDSWVLLLFFFLQGVDFRLMLDMEGGIKLKFPSFMRKRCV